MVDETRTSAQFVPLSPREMQVIKALAVGQSIKGIATTLAISRWTVKSHLANVRRKLNLSTNAEVIHILTKSGQI
ncbi:MAG: helix-turn-helix transcriptional regulator [Anaerolineaceae bacterium]|nr:helix-turn-helix transcriptional regulator [Anaerolineaceae bacterium]MDD5367527.1 helix-turn-helix transcriptional regulator [Anaerolineaceae bacterium]